VPYGIDFIWVSSIPFTDTRQPRTLPICTLRTHFSGFNFSWALHMLVKVSAKFSIYVAFLLLATTMSSTYVKTFLYIWFFRMALVILQNVGPTFLRSLGILR
jgi:hypothetical protein